MILPPRSPLPGLRHAIVIGANGSIASGLAPLIAPEAHDAPRMAAVLASPACGFHVQPFLGDQALMQPIRDAIETQMRAGTIGDSLIIYFSGHGTITQTAEGPDVVLVTTDTTLETIQDDPLICLRVGWLKTVLRGNTQMYPIGHVVVILDCCSSGIIDQLGNQPQMGDMPAFRRMLVSTYTSHPAYEWNRTSLYTYHLLNALEGQAVDSFGAVTMERVHQYCSEKLAGTEQRCGLGGWDYTGRWQFAWYDLQHPKLIHAAHHVESDRLLNLRLEGFVGRVTELADIHEHIAAIRPTGGYVVIKALAGEGKSSIIAKLIQDAGIAQTPHHFIALTTGRTYQLELLHTVVAQLILKHNLSRAFGLGDHVQLLKGEFFRLLDYLSKQGIEETIYLDGLDQLQPDIDGSRDLSFLPPQPPPGIVIVLGSRPDETLIPFKEKGLYCIEYDLRPLGKSDALALWRSVQPGVADDLFHDLYDALKGNALFVRLAADTMRDQSMADTASLIKQIKRNPNDLFGITLGRIKGRSLADWRAIWKPMLAFLLVAQEPLHLDVLGDLLGHDHDTMQDATLVLGGLVSQGIDQRVALHHLLFRDYLAASVFNDREVKRWQQRLADWCAVDLNTIWADDRDPIEQARRVYARHHYVTHLSLAENWPALWQVLDSDDYGEQKTRFDPSTRLYALDLDRGRESAINAGKSIDEHIQNLPRLWKYSLLRTSLTSRVDQWPDEAFEVLAMLGRTHEALERIELISDVMRQIRLWGKVIQWCDEQQQIITLRMRQCLRVIGGNHAALIEIIRIIATIGDIGQALTIAHTVQDNQQQAEAYTTIASIINTTEDSIPLLEQATFLGQAIHNPLLRAHTLATVINAFATVNAIDHALALAYSIDIDRIRTKVLAGIAQTVAARGDQNSAELLIGQAINISDTLKKDSSRSTVLIAIAKAIVATGNVDYALTIINNIDTNGSQELAREHIALTASEYEFFDHAIRLTESISDNWRRNKTFSSIALIAAKKGFFDQAIAITQYTSSYKQVETLAYIAEAAARLNNYDYAKTLSEKVFSVVQTMSDEKHRAEALIILARTAAILKDHNRAIMILKQTLLNKYNQDDRYRDESLRAIADVYITVNDLNQAITIAQTLTRNVDRDSLLSVIAKAFALDGNINQAHIIAGSIKSVWSRSHTVASIAKATAMMGNIEDAVTQAQSIQEVDAQVTALSAISQILSSKGNQQKARSLRKQAIQTSRLITESDSHDKAIMAIAQLYAVSHYFDHAISIIKGINNIWTCTETLISIAQIALTSDKVQEALLIFNQACLIVKSRTSDIVLAEVLSVIGQATARAGFIEQAILITQDIEDHGKKSKTLSIIAQAMAAAGDYKQAQSLVKEAISLTLFITELDDRLEALVAIIVTLAVSGDLGTAIHLAQLIPDLWNRTKALTSILEAHSYNNEVAIDVIQWEWLMGVTNSDMWNLLLLSTPLLKTNLCMGIVLLEGEQWVQEQLIRIAR
ncbi:peptidase C14 caspase catalytic subunit p20 (plasmid) [Herpetosiphon aurantiacus DSM 785]|uniref:Peptidase C14 caspase catalytic subunit p20 n=1 Tax=Herpetosiphon aurantiacus (strain ATCC 23779 / DSM 785 / 114-95) TaxID=316274 RepID=A9B8Y0_HERA2|nr:peptidase C14 caspase catalytic subunit p20 [Herpetosiphon aurantiacus DSM 785]